MFGLTPNITVVSLAVTILLYGDDLLIIISLPLADAVRILEQVMAQMTSYLAH